MKGLRYFKIVLVVQLLCTGLAGFTQEMTKNPHKFTEDNWKLKESCNPCHIYTSDNQSEGKFIVSYDSDTIITSDSIYISGVSKLCISCHDGIIAGFDYSVNPWYLLDGRSRYSHNHPVSILYKTKKKGRYKLHDPDSTSSGLGGTIAEDLLVNGRVECISCHNAHFSMEKIACSTCPKIENDLFDEDYMSLWKTNRRSLLCLTCHHF